MTRLLDRGIEVVSASCDTHDVYKDTIGKGYIGKTVQMQIELGHLYPATMFECLPPDWLTYEYHTIEEHKHIGSAYTGLSQVDSFVNVDDDELEFATALTIDSAGADGYRAVWTLAGEL